VVAVGLLLASCSAPARTEVTESGSAMPAGWERLGDRPAPLVTGAALAVGDGAIFVWGGEESWGTGTPTAGGAILRSSAEEWVEASPAPLPPMSNPVAVCTDDRVLVCCGDGRGAANGLASYEADRDEWTEGAAPPVASPNAVEAVWTGTEMLVLVGSEALLASYAPAADRWVERAKPPYVSVSGFEVAWTGNILIAWPRFDRETRQPLLYDPGSDSWDEMDVPPELADIDTPALVWTGSQLLAWGVGIRAPSTQIGAIWSPEDGWSVMPPAPLPLVDWHEGTPGSQQMVWTGSEVVVWVGALDDEPYDHVIPILGFDPTTGSWQEHAPFTMYHENLVAWEMVATNEGLVLLTNSGDYVLRTP